MQFTAMTAHLEIDYLLNTCSWIIIAKRCTAPKKNNLTVLVNE